MSGRWERVKEVLDAALRLPTHERVAFLDAECAGEPELRTEIDELVRAAERADAGFLVPPPLEKLPSDCALGSGSRLGEFELVREIGRGGMGVVFLARQAGLGRSVAIKVLSVGLTTSQRQIDRFAREARSVARLAHPNIVSIISVGTERGIHFFAMEYVDGKNLAEEIARLRNNSSSERNDNAELPSSHASHYFRSVAETILQAADGLACAHQNGIIHRDIKPSNLLLDNTGRVRIVDFGLARDEEQGSLSTSDDVAGTPHYMSPEQACAQRAKIDQRTDIYSLGVALYELLTLRRPFEGKTSQEVISSLLHKEPPRIRKLNSRVPRDLEIICTKAMAKEASARYASAGALRDDLRHFLNHEAILAKAPSPWTRIRSWGNRHRIPVVAIFALLLGLGSAALFHSFRERREREERWRSKIEAALLASSWDLAIPAVVEARQALREIEAAGSVPSPLCKAVLTFQERLADDDRRRVFQVQERVEAAHRSNSVQERTRELLAAVSEAGRSAMLHEDDEWLARAARVESVFPRLAIDLEERAGGSVLVGSRAIDPITGTLGVEVVLGKAPLDELPVAPGDYRFVLRADDGRSAEIERDCRALGERMVVRGRLFAGRPEDVGMIRIPGGEFVLDRTRPLGCCRTLDSVVIVDFYLDEAEVSNGDYLLFLQATGHAAPSVWRESGYDGVDWHSLPVESQEDRWPDLPVCGTSWEDARDYAEWVGKRLPTHLELEWALRGPELLRRPWGEGDERHGILANIDGPGRGAVHSWRDSYAEALRALQPVRAPGFRQPPRELFHGFGNVQEWTSSRVVEWSGERPVVHDLGRYYMGCDWGAAADGDTLDDHAYTNIGDAHASLRVGFRCARTALD